MPEVGEYYGEATEMKIIETTYGGYPVQIRYNHWADVGEECVTQRIGTPPTKYGQYSFFEWLAETAATAAALHEEGFSAIDSYDDAVIWSRPA